MGYKAEYKGGADKEKASESARQAYQDAHNVAEKDLAVTHPIRLGLALNYSVFQYEVLGNADHAAAPRQLDLVDFGPGGRRAVSVQGEHDLASIAHSQTSLMRAGRTIQIAGPDQDCSSRVA